MGVKRITVRGRSEDRSEGRSEGRSGGRSEGLGYTPRSHIPSTYASTKAPGRSNEVMIPHGQVSLYMRHFAIIV